MLKRKQFRTVVMSDIHMGTKFSKIREAADFLSRISCSNLILNGDIIDGWQLKKNNPYWGHENSRFFRILFRMTEISDTQVYLLRGNHDDFLDKIIPMNIGYLNIQKDLILNTGERQYFVTHGDVFDCVTSNMRWLAKLGDGMYKILLLINMAYNQIRRFMGKPYYSFSQAIKNKVKTAVASASNFDQMLADMAKAKGCNGVICGHIHRPENRVIDGVHYLNSGDWVETMSAVVEDMDGEWHIIYYKDMINDEV